MTEDKALATTEEPSKAKQNEALLRAIGFDKLAPEQRALGLNIAKRYGLDLLLKHLVIIEGRVYVTRDGLLHVAHNSRKLDGIETSEPVIRDGFWRATCSVYRKDMSRPFTYFGRYPTSGGNQKYAPEMAVKVSEVMALRRAFDVAAPTQEERWDRSAIPESESAAVPTLAERTAAKAAEITAKVEPLDVHVVTQEDMEAEADLGSEGPGFCGATSDPRLGPVETCHLTAGHPSTHESENGAVWTCWAGKERAG